MRLSLACLLAMGLLAGCDHRSSSATTPGPAPAGSPRTVADSPAPRELKTEAPNSTTSPRLGPSISGIFKPIGERTTDDLIAEVEHFATKDRLPLIAELATRTQDRPRILPVLKKLFLDGRYAVRVAAATAVVALDPEHVSRHAVDLSAVRGNKAQAPVYGPLQDDTPELRQIQAAAVPGLVRVLDKETTAGGTYPETGGCLAALASMPAEVGKPAVEAVKKVAATAMHPHQLPAQELLKKWGAA